MHVDKFIKIITFSRYISLRWDVVFPPPYNITTLFVHRSTLLVIILLYMILNTIMLLVCYTPIQIFQINQRLIFQMMMWFILWYMILWRQWNERNVRYAMNMILYVESNLKWVMTLNLYMITLNKILEINYTYVSLEKPMSKYILVRVKNTVYIS